KRPGRSDPRPAESRKEDWLPYQRRSCWPKCPPFQRLALNARKLVNAWQSLETMLPGQRLSNLFREILLLIRNTITFELLRFGPPCWRVKVLDRVAWRSIGPKARMR